MEREITNDNISSKPKRKWNDTILILYVLTNFLMLMGEILGGHLISSNLFAGNQSSAYITGRMYIAFIGIWIVMLLYIRFTKKNRPILQELGTKVRGNNWKLFLLGIFIGFALNGMCILIAWLHGDIKLVFDSFRPISFILIFVCVFIQSSAEEFVCRGFLYQRLRRSYQQPAVAIIGNAVFFGLIHWGNPGITVLAIINLIALGILCSLMVYYLDSIWCAMAFHTAWNFTQNILFGLPNSGLVLPYSVFKLDASTATDSIAYDVKFGIEGTLFVTIMMMIASIILYVASKKGKAADQQVNA